MTAPGLIAPGLKFATLRLIILTAAALAQVFLFLQLRQALRSSRLSERCRSWASGMVAAVIILLCAINYYIMTRPLPWVHPPWMAKVILFYPATVWSLGSTVAALLLVMVQLLAALGRRSLRFLRGEGARAAASPVNHDRRGFLRAGATGLVAAPLALSGYGAVYAGKALEVSQLSLPFGRSLKVVQVSDIHAGLFMTREEVRRLVDQVVPLQPDLFVLTGDYISNSMKSLPGCVAEMARVRPRYGTFAIMGNHEWWYGELPEIIAIFRRHRIALLRNAHRVIPSEQGYFAVAGIDDLYAGRPDLGAALDGLDSAMPVLLLSHRPEVFPRAAARGIPLTLAGHYHGGQIKLSLPGGGDFSLAHLMTPYPEGLYRLKGCHLYVSRGIGTTFTPIRLNARPEVTVFHLT